MSTEQAQVGDFKPDCVWDVFLGLRCRESVGNHRVFFSRRDSRKIAGMADDLTWAGIAGIAILAGVGFTVALFISGLSFEDETVSRRGKSRCARSLLGSGRNWLPLPSLLVKRQLSTILNKTGVARKTVQESVHQTLCLPSYFPIQRPVSALIEVKFARKI